MRRRNDYMRIYLDNCCYNRPYDDQNYLSIHLETLAKLHIQELIKNSVYELATSDMLYYEVSQMPHMMHRTVILKFIKEHSSVHAGIQNLEEIENIIKVVMQTGIKYKDAFHVAAAIFTGCEYLLTTDKRLLKYSSSQIKLINPIDFVSIMEKRND